MRQPIGMIRVRIEKRDKPNTKPLLETDYVIKICNLVYEYHFLTTEQVYRFVRKGVKRNEYLDKLLLRLWRDGYLEKFKMIMEGSKFQTNFYLLGDKGKVLLLKKNYKDYDLTELENYKVGEDVHFASFEHHYLSAEFASMEFLNSTDENKIIQLGEKKSQIIFGEEKNMILAPDFITFRDNKTILNEIEVSPKSPSKRLQKLSKYLSYKKNTGENFILRFIFSNPMREIAYWNWCKKELPDALEKLNIYSTSLNFIQKFEDMEKEIYFLPKLTNIPKYPMGINRYDQRLEVMRIGL